MGLHKVENIANGRSISMHVYSPPYLECANGDVTVPVVYCNIIEKEQNQLQVWKFHGNFTGF
jgi:hypothetical protein